MRVVDGVPMTDDEYREYVEGAGGGDSGGDSGGGDSGGGNDGGGDTITDPRTGQVYTLPPGVTRADAEDFIRRNTSEHGADYHRLSDAYRPTFSAGGRGGDLDTNDDAQLDPGWSYLNNDGGGRWNWWGQGPQPTVAGVAPGQYHPSVSATISGLSRGAGPEWMTGGNMWDGRDVGGGSDITAPGTPDPSSGYQAPTMPGAPQAYRPFSETYAAPTWTGGEFSFDPSKIRDNPAYQVRLSDTIKAVDRGSAAKGLSFTNQAREELLRRAGDLASNEIENEFGRQYSTYGQNRGAFERDRDFGRGTYLDRAGIHDRNELNRFNTERTNLTDARSRDSDLWGRGRAEKLDTWGRDDSLWTRGRLDRNDQWSRGTDVWQMNRADRNDHFDQNYRLSDLVLARRPRPY